MKFSAVQAREDFNRAKNKAQLKGVLNIMQPEVEKLLSFYSIRALLKPKSETYRGMQVVKISDIVGSEGRYHDFTKAFLPKREHLRHRWERVDTAIIEDIILPPIKLYKLGEVYFVRDGNHRVSVARTQKMEAIDAEVVELNTEVPFSKGMTEQDMKKQIIKYERKRFMDFTRLPQYIDTDAIHFTAPGRYEELGRYIRAHQESLSKERGEEVDFGEAAKQWFNDIYLPFIQYIEKKGLISRFPGRTTSDLFIWIFKRWDEVVKVNPFLTLEQAAGEFSDRHGKGWWSRLRDAMRKKRRA